jgi:hypothetical protein
MGSEHPAQQAGTLVYTRGDYSPFFNYKGFGLDQLDVKMGSWQIKSLTGVNNVS